jgi:hypothetical protein
MKKWITSHPYFVTSIVFFIIMLIGWRMLYWREESFGFLLLIYFIVTLAIRLDDISRKLGSSTGGQPPPGISNEDNIIGQLNAIRASLLVLNSTLNKLLKDAEDKES